MVIPYGRQHIEEDDIRAIAKVLKSDMLTQGPVTQNLKRRSPLTVALNMLWR